MKEVQHKHAHIHEFMNKFVQIHKTSRATDIYFSMCFRLFLIFVYRVMFADSFHVCRASL